jgi:hypothetical protein
MIHSPLVLSVLVPMGTILALGGIAYFALEISLCVAYIVLFDADTRVLCNSLLPLIATLYSMRTSNVKSIYTVASLLALLLADTEVPSSALLNMACGAALVHNVVYVYTTLNGGWRSIASLVFVLVLEVLALSVYIIGETMPPAASLFVPIASVALTAAIWRCPQRMKKTVKFDVVRDLPPLEIVATEFTDVSLDVASDADTEPIHAALATPNRKRAKV